MLAKIKILVVEDESIIAMDLQYRLTTLGYSVVALASSGKEAINAAQEFHPDLILMDIILIGKMDGTVAAKHINSQQDIPIAGTHRSEKSQGYLSSRPRGRKTKPSHQFIETECFYWP